MIEQVHSNLCVGCGFDKRYSKRLFCRKCINIKSEQKRTEARAKNVEINDLLIIVGGVLYKERWKDINGYDGVYKISDFGRVKSFKFPVNRINGVIMNGGITKKGYKFVGLSKNNISKNYYVHRLVALHFIPNTENKPEVNHIGKDKNGKITKSDNNYLSLEWVTKSENELHKNINGNGIQGIRHPSVKLTEDNVIYIRNSKQKAKVLSEKFNVTTTVIYNIRSLKIWKHIVNDK